MAKALKVTINKTHYSLKFGYGVFRRLGEYYQVKGFQGLGKYVDGLGFGKTNSDLTFDQLNFLGNLIIAAVEYDNADPNVKLDLDQVIDQVVLAQPQMLEGVLTAFTESFPSADPVGKTNPATRKKTAKK